MTFAPGYLAEHPLPPGIAGALSLSGYQLLVDVAGVGAGRLGPQAFLVLAADPDPVLPDAGTQISLHQTKLRDEREMAGFVQLAAQLGYLRLSGYRLALERAGLRSKIRLINPATGAIAAQIPDKHPGRLLGGGTSAATLLAAVRGLATAARPPGPGAVAPGPAGARVARRHARRRRGGRAGRPRADARRAEPEPRSGRRARGGEVSGPSSSAR